MRRMTASLCSGLGAGLVRDGPAHNALARFVDLMNEHMDEVVDKLPSFRYWGPGPPTHLRPKTTHERGVRLRRMEVSAAT
jgi:hypothetical protein